MSASTMTFLNVAPAAAAQGAPAEATLADGADFTAALAALAAAPVAGGKPGLQSAAVPVVEGGDAVLDAEAIAALLAGMLPAAAPSATQAPLPAGDGGESLDADSLLDAADSLSASMPGAEAGAAAAALAASATAGASMPDASDAEAAALAQRLLPDAASAKARAAQLPAQAAAAQAALPEAAQDATPAAGAPVPASALLDSLLAARGTGLREAVSGGARAIDMKAATQGLRNLMQAMAQGEAADAGAEGVTTALAGEPSGPVLEELKALLAARGANEAALANLPANAGQPELSSQAAPSPAAAALLHANANSAVASTSAGTEQAVRTPVGTPRWAEELGNQLVLMNARGQQEGSLTLTPEHLGPLEVRISVSHNTANVWFGAQHADTRAALNEALPRLRELFNEAGLSLGQAGVSQEAPRQDRREAAAQEFTGTQGREAGSEREVPATVRRITRGLLDTYA